MISYHCWSTYYERCGQYRYSMYRIERMNNARQCVYCRANYSVHPVLCCDQTLTYVKTPKAIDETVIMIAAVERKLKRKTSGNVQWKAFSRAWLADGYYIIEQVRNIDDLRRSDRLLKTDHVKSVLQYAIVYVDICIRRVVGRFCHAVLYATVIL